ncbi:hypothetical protein LMG7974_01613 [Campylobacter majalis]|uniref:Periplasmic protein n=1 Tax=Campylobacter majalis TaxID=2790656 RepID=A0ABM8Q968_9BACT|nr:hypothetical protein [Campylobacter majalis]CAD7289536.1 hypothetical protein LMG7974_01613 [Campylobacter majalis]
MKDKKILIFIVILVVAIISIAFIIKPDDNNNGIVVSQPQDIRELILDTNNTLTDKNGTFIPPKMEINPFVQNTQNLADNKEEAIKNSANVSTQEPKIADMTNYENINQEESIKRIAKRQKPNDMIAFLKEKQNEFSFNAREKSFKFDMKEYLVGDKFLDFFEITDISQNFIRFKDNSYEYNLRFIKE